MTARTRFIINTIIALVFVLAVALVYLGLLNYVKNSRDNLEVIDAKIASLEKERRAVRIETMLLAERTADLKRIREFFVNRETPLPFIEALETLAKNTQNRVALDFAEEESSNDTLAFRLTIEGSKFSALRYLSLLEIMLYDIEIKDLTFQKIPSQSKDVSASRIILLIRVKTK